MSIPINSVGFYSFWYYEPQAGQGFSVVKKINILELNAASFTVVFAPYKKLKNGLQVLSKMTIK